MAESRNPSLAASRHEIDAAEARVEQAGLFPNPSVGYRIDDAPASHDRFHEGTQWLELSQPFILGNRRRAGVEAARSGVEVQRARYEMDRRMILTQAAESFFDALYRQEAVERVRQLQTVAKESGEITRTRYKAGAEAELELLKAEIEVARLDVELSNAEKGLAVARAALAEVIGGGALPAKLEGSMTAAAGKEDGGSLREKILRQHPLVLGALHSLAEARSVARKARAEVVPDLRVNVGVGHNGAEDDTVVMGGMEIELPVFNRNQGAIREADVRIAQAELDVQARRNAVERSVAETVENYNRALEQVRLFADQIVPKAQRAVEQAQTGYRSGKFPFLTVLDAERTLGQTRLGLLEAEREAAQNRARLRGMLGEFGE